MLIPAKSSLSEPLLRPLEPSRLEQALRNFTCLTPGDIIEISYNSMVLDFLIMDCKPAGAGIDVVDTDIEVRLRITVWAA